MSEQTKIPWCDSTINFWEDCTKVSPGCVNCYAEARDKRMMIEPVIHWGKGALRRKSKSAVQQALAMNRKPWVCDACGYFSDDRRTKGGLLYCAKCECFRHYHRRRVFSLSLGDWLDPDVPIEWLAEMLDTIRKCDAVNWILCTKRPELFLDRMWHVLNAGVPQQMHLWLLGWVDMNTPPSNVWILTSVEDQKRADERIPNLLKIPAVVRGLSCEPLLGLINLNETKGYWGGIGLHWVIVGGESGKNARPCDVRWIRSLKDQCQAAGVPVFVKQLGSNPVITRPLMGYPFTRGADEPPLF